MNICDDKLRSTGADAMERDRQTDRQIKRQTNTASTQAGTNKEDRELHRLD